MHFGSCCDPDARWSGLLIRALAQASSCHSPYKLALSKPASSLQSSGLPKVQCAASLPQEPPCLPHHRNTDSKLLCFAYAQGCTLLGSAHSPVLSLFLCFPLGSQAPARSPTAQTYPMLSDLQSLTCTLPSSQPILLAATTVQGTPTHPSILGLNTSSEKPSWMTPTKSKFSPLCPHRGHHPLALSLWKCQDHQK